MNTLFQGAANTTIYGGIFTAASNVGGNSLNPSASNDIVNILYSRCAPAGLLDTEECFDAPKCDKDTRVSMLRAMKKFVQEGGPSSPPAMYWLHGPAGVGKSALVQSLALSLKEERDHAASFFFSRTAHGRDNGNQLIVTLAYQLAISFPALQPFISKTVKTNPAILTASNIAKMQGLIVDPINEWQKKSKRGIWRWARKLRNIDTKPHPRLILVDGLDECNNPDVQRDLLLCIGRAVQQLLLPFRFVIASRPESHILATFELDPIFQVSHGVNVSIKNLGDDEDADKQITIFLLNEFADIRRTHPIREYLPERWPDPSQITQLVSKSSQGFIYPATVIRYIKMPYNRPDECLERILGLSEIPFHDKPYEPLDRVYRHIFESVPDVNKEAVRNVFLFLVMPNAMYGLITPAIIERHLNFKPGHVGLVLHDLMCLVEFKTSDDPITVLHASLPDFLLDHSRSGPFCIDIGDAHATVAASFLQLFAPGHRLKAPMFAEFLNHLMQANVTDDLLDFVTGFDLVTEYQYTYEATEKTRSSASNDDQPDDAVTSVSPDPLLECITFLVAYVLALVVKKIPIFQITQHIRALEEFLLRNYLLASAFQAVDDEMLKEIIPTLREWILIDHTCSDIILGFYDFRSQIGKAICRLHLLLVSRFFASPAPTKHDKLTNCDDTLPQMTEPLHTRISRALLSFLISDQSLPLARGPNELLGRLAIQIIIISLPQSRYSPPLLSQLEDFIAAAKDVKRQRKSPISCPARDEFLAFCIDQLAPSIASHCVRLQSEVSVSGDQLLLERLNDLISKCKQYSAEM